MYTFLWRNMAAMAEYDITHLEIAYLKFEKRNQYAMVIVMHCANFVIRGILVYRICRLRCAGELRIGGCWITSTHTPPSICIPANSPLSILISVAIFARGVSPRINSIRNNSKQENVHVRRVTEKKMTLMQQHAWKTSAMLRHVFNNVGYIYRKRRCGKSGIKRECTIGTAS